MRWNGDEGTSHTSRAGRIRCAIQVMLIQVGLWTATVSVTVAGRVERTRLSFASILP